MSSLLTSCNVWPYLFLLQSFLSNLWSLKFVWKTKLSLFFSYNSGGIWMIKKKQKHCGSLPKHREQRERWTPSPQLEINMNMTIWKVTRESNPVPLNFHTLLFRKKIVINNHYWPIKYRETQFEQSWMVTNSMQNIPMHAHTLYCWYYAIVVNVKNPSKSLGLRVRWCMHIFSVKLRNVSLLPH